MTGWQNGKIVNGEVAREIITPGAVTTVTETGSTTRIIHREITDTTVTIRGIDYEYVAERQPSSYLQSRTGLVSGIILSRDHGCRFIVGDTAIYSADKSKLYVIDADGKQCKLNIIRQERVQTTAQVQAAPLK